VALSATLAEPSARAAVIYECHLLTLFTTLTVRYQLGKVQNNNKTDKQIGRFEEKYQILESNELSK
jgi:hypothetical protein